MQHPPVISSLAWTAFVVSRKTLWAVLIMGLVSCSTLTDTKEPDPNDREVAVVGDEKLMLSEITPLINDTLTTRDSNIFIQNYAERWVRDKLLIREAEQYIPDNVDIDQLVSDYKSSLLVHHFEQQIIAEKLDTTVSEEEILKFYEKNKDQFQNDRDLVRAFFIKLKKPFPDQRKMESWWKDPNGTNLIDLRNYCQNYAAYFNLETAKWIDYNDIVRQLPRGSVRFTDLKPGYERNFADFNYQYLIRVFESVPSTDNPPVALIADQARMIILHERKIKLLERVKQELYDKAIHQSSVKIWTK